MTPEIQKLGADARSKYSDEQREFVKIGWAAGKSAGVIAVDFSARFGVQVTRNIIIGIKSRLGLPDRQTTVCRSYHNQKHITPPKPPKKAKEPRVDLEAPSPIGPVGDFPDSKCCKWPVDDLPNFRCCGQPQFGRGPYCEHHMARRKDPTKKKMDGTSRSDRAFSF